MANNYPLPEVAKVIEILGLLFDGLQVKPGGSFDLTPGGGAWFGVFVSDGGDPVALCGADVNLVANFGAAFSMLPVNAAKEAAKTRELTGVMVDNVREIMNICTRLVMDNTSPHLRLEQLYSVKTLPAAAAALLTAAARRREFQLQIPKYGAGVLTLLAA
jgi:hypothetical protein